MLVSFIHFAFSLVYGAISHATTRAAQAEPVPPKVAATARRY